VSKNGVNSSLLISYSDIHQQDTTCWPQQEHDAGVMIALPKRSLGLGTARQMTRIIVFLQYSKVDTWISITVNGIHPMRGFLLPIRWQSWLKIIPTWHRSRVHNSRSPSSWLSVAWQDCALPFRQQEARGCFAVRAAGCNKGSCCFGHQTAAAAAGYPIISTGQHLPGWSKSEHTIPTSTSSRLDHTVLAVPPPSSDCN